MAFYEKVSIYDISEMTVLCKMHILNCNGSDMFFSVNEIISFFEIESLKIGSGSWFCRDQIQCDIGGKQLS